MGFVVFANPNQTKPCLGMPSVWDDEGHNFPKLSAVSPGKRCRYEVPSAQQLDAEDATEDEGLGAGSAGRKGGSGDSGAGGGLFEVKDIPAASGAAAAVTGRGLQEQQQPLSRKAGVLLELLAAANGGVGGDLDAKIVQACVAPISFKAYRIIWGGGCVSPQCFGCLATACACVVGQ
jgi:hypothetical protein